MRGMDQPSSSDQKHVNLAGEYCTLQPLPLATTSATQKQKFNRSTQQQTRQIVYKTTNNNQTLSSKREISRSKSNPERSYYNIDTKQSAQLNATQRTVGPLIVGPARKSVGHAKIVGRRSTGSVSSKDQPPPLCYFAYLGKLNPARGSQRGRLPSAHSVLTERPVILTSATVVSTFATNEICQEFEELEKQEKQFDYNEVIDCCTCMCCVKGLFYHCTKDSENEGRLAEYPCSCRGPVTQCLGRWGVMALLSIVMPCLLCYLPVEGCFRCYDCIKRGNKGKDKNPHQAPESSSSYSDEPPVVLSIQESSCTDVP